MKKTTTSQNSKDSPSRPSIPLINSKKLSNSLFIFWDKIPNELVRDFFAKNKNPDTTFNAVLIKNMGGPDKAKFYANFFDYLQQKDHYKFFNNIVIDTNDDRVKEYRPIIQRCLDDLNRAFGSFDDSLDGVKNIAKNIKSIVECPDVNQLKPKADKAIMVMAGSSLEQDLPKLKEVQDDYFLLGCDAVLKRCIKEGIKLDAVITSERIPLVEHFFKDLNPEDVKETLLIANVVTWPSTWNLYPGPKAKFFRADTISEWFKLKERKLLWAPPVVSSVALATLGHLGFKKIATLGQDVAYHPETGQSHSDIKINKFKSWSQPDAWKNQDQKIIELEGNEVPKVKSTERLFQFGTELHRISLVYRLELTNTSRLGAKIPGLKYQHFEDWLNENPSNKYINHSWLDRNPSYKRDLRYLKGRINSAIKQLSEPFDYEKYGTDIKKLLRSYYHFGYLALPVILRGFAYFESNKFGKDWTISEQYPEMIKLIEEARIEILKCLKEMLENLESS